MTFQVTGSKLLFNEPMPLNADQHGDYGLTPSETPYQFAAQTHFVPVTESEIMYVCADYPIVFMGEENLPVAVLGRQAGENLFVSDSGLWRENHYIPAYVRQYPFVLAHDNAAAGGAQESILCIDRTTELLSNNDPDNPFFANGTPSDFLRNAMQLCQSVDQDFRSTKAKMEKIKKTGILEMMTLNIHNNISGHESDQSSTAPMQFMGANADKILTMEDAEKLAFIDQGLLTLLYGFLFAQKNWPKLFAAGASAS